MLGPCCALQDAYALDEHVLCVLIVLSRSSQEDEMHASGATGFICQAAAVMCFITLIPHHMSGLMVDYTLLHAHVALKTALHKPEYELH